MQLLSDLDYVDGGRALLPAEVKTSILNIFPERPSESAFMLCTTFSLVALERLCRTRTGVSCCSVTSPSFSSLSKTSFETGFAVTQSAVYRFLFSSSPCFRRVISPLVTKFKEFTRTPSCWQLINLVRVSASPLLSFVFFGLTHSKAKGRPEPNIRTSTSSLPEARNRTSVAPRNC